MLHAFIGVGLFCLPDSRGQSASVPGRIWLFERRSACRVHACAKTGASTFNPRHSALDIRYHGLFHFFAAPVQPPARTRLQDRLPACGPRPIPDARSPSPNPWRGGRRVSSRSFGSAASSMRAECTKVGLPQAVSLFRFAPIRQ
jgi:hypothetical protein